MPFIKVNPNALSSIRSSLKLSRDNADDVKDDFGWLTFWMDWDVKDDIVDDKIALVKSQLKAEIGRLKQFYKFMDTAIEEYEDAEYDPEREAAELERRKTIAAIWNWTVVGLCIVAGVAVSVLTGGAAIPAIIASACTGAVMAGTQNLTGQYVEDGFEDGVDWGSFGTDVAIGTVTGAVSGAIGAGANAASSKITSALIKPGASGLQRIGISVVVGSTSDITSGVLTRGTTEYIKTGEIDTALKSALDPGEMVKDGVIGGVSSGVEEYTAIRKAQKAANKAASDYNGNQKSTPIQDGEKAGLKGLKETPNHGVNFEDSDHILRLEDGEPVQIKIKATGDRVKDYEAAEAALKKQGIDIDFKKMRTGKDKSHVWHHLDDYDAMTGETTLQFIEVKAHKAIKTHSGSAKQYHVVHGQGYDKKVVKVDYKGVKVDKYVNPVLDYADKVKDANKSIDQAAEKAKK